MSNINYERILNNYRNKLSRSGDGGNVDLTNRPIVSAEDMANAGYDIGNGYATTYTNTFSDPYGKVAGNFTPIQAQNGRVQDILPATDLQDYAEAVIDGRRNDDLGLQIGTLFRGDNAIDDASREAERQHQMQELYHEMLTNYFASPNAKLRGLY